jgi:ribosomal protein S18 acetylase RimI-like enzyme
MLIRPHTEADRPAVQEIRARAWRKTYTGLLPGEIIQAATTPPAPGTRPGNRGGLLVPEHILSSRTGLVACEEEKILGFAIGGLPREDFVPADCELWAIYVDPEIQGQGIGRALLLEFKNAMRAQGKKRLLLWTLKENRSARRFYEKLGGQLSEPEKMFRWEGKEIAAEVPYAWEL